MSLDVLLFAAGGTFWPPATCCCPFLEPFPSVGGSAHRPLTILYHSLAYPHLPTHPSFPFVGCANGAPGLSTFYSFVAGPHRGGQQPSPLARCMQTPHTSIEEAFPTAAFGPLDVHLSVTSFDEGT